MSRQNILIIDESKNTYGTYKDRRSKFIVDKANAKHVSKLCLITSGNAGYSLAKLAKPYGIKIVCVVDINLKQSIKIKLKKACYKVIEQDLKKNLLTPESIIALSREDKKEVIWDVTNGYSEAYSSIVNELQNHKIDFIVCPVGSGECFIGIHDALKINKLKVKLIGVSTKSNPSFADKLATPWTPYSSRIKAALKEGHKLIRLSEDEIIKAYNNNKSKYRCEPSSSVVWSIFDKINFDGKKVLVINSGKGLI